MKTILLGLISLMMVTANASEMMTINIDNTSFVKANNIQAVYSSPANFFCGEYKKGSFVSKLEFVNNEPSESLEIKKTFKSGFCRYKLSDIIILAPNFAGNPQQFVSLSVLNSYSHKSLKRLPVAEKFNYFCSDDVKSDYGCKADGDIASIKSSEIFITLENK